MMRSLGLLKQLLRARQDERSYSGRCKPREIRQSTLPKVRREAKDRLMANAQHIKWLEAGVDAWNKRRENENFRPDFSGHNFGGRTLFETNRRREPKEWERILLRGINLTNAILSQSDLRVVDLSNADFYRADLKRASLSQAILVGSDFRFANLTGSNFVNADLTGAMFGGYGARLTDANLQANVTDADFREADLTDVELLPGDLWKSKLFWSHRSPWQYRGKLALIETVGHFLQTIREIKQFQQTRTEEQGKTAKGHNHYEEVFLYFRGESRCGRVLRPSVMRDGLELHEGTMLRDLITRRPEEFSGMSSALGRWVIAQHHGLRTRFLDITRNPLIALFYACAEDGVAYEDGRLKVFATPRSQVKPYDSDFIGIFGNFARLPRDYQLQILNSGRHRHSEATRRLYQLIRSDNPYFEERLDPRDFYRMFDVEPQRSSERI